MNKTSIILIILVSLLSTQNSHGQNATRMAKSLRSLHQQLVSYPEPEKPGYEADIVIALSQRFFQVLLSNDTLRTSTIDELHLRYKANPFLTSVVDEVHTKFNGAVRAKANTIQLFGVEASKKITIAQQAQAVLLTQVAKYVRRQLVQDASDTTLVKTGKSTLESLYSQITKVPNGSHAVKGRQVFLLQDSVIGAVQRQLNSFYSSKRSTNAAASFLTDIEGPLRKALVEYVKPQLSTKEKLDSLEIPYTQMREAYTSAYGLAQTGARSVQELDKARSIENAILFKQLTYAASFQPSIGLPVAAVSALLKSPRATGGAVSAEGALLDGTTRFLADRLKQELNATFFQRFATLLHDSAYVELQVLFPSTARLLTSGSAEYGTIVQTLRGTFERDLRELLFNYSTLLERQKFYRTKWGAETPTGQVLRYSYAAARAHYYLTHGAHPADLIGRLRIDLTTSQLTNPSLLKTLGLVNVLSEALVDDTNLKRQWLPLDTVSNQLKSPAIRELFLGLVLERAKPYLEVRYTGRMQFQQLAVEFVTLSGQLQTQTSFLQKQAVQAQLHAEDFVPLYQNLQRSLEFAMTYGSQLANNESPNARSAKLALFQRISDDLMLGYVAADKGDYGVTLSNFLDIVLLTLAPTAGPFTTEPTSASVGPLSVKAATNNVRNALNQLPQPARSQLLSLPQVVRYGSFMAAIAQAKTSDDVKDALEAAALPVGSASIKRRSFNSISVNAFAGVTAGGEWAYLSKAQQIAGVSNIDNTRFNLGPTAPLGLSFAWGLRGDVQALRLRAIGKSGTRQRAYVARLRRLDQAYRYYDNTGRERYLRGSAVGVFVSVIDLGVPVLLRFSDDKATALPENIGFRQVLAPGVFGFYHLRGMPLSLFIGSQFTPQLRELSQVSVPTGTSAELPFRNSLRFNLGLTVDIPLFQLFTRTEPRGDSPPRRVVEKQALTDVAQYQIVLRNDSLVRNLGQSAAKGLSQVAVQNQLTMLTEQLNTWLNNPSMSRQSEAKLLSDEVNKLVEEAKNAAGKANWKKVAELRVRMDQVIADKVPKLEAGAKQAAQKQKQNEQGAKQGVAVPVPTQVIPMLTLPK